LLPHLQARAKTATEPDPRCELLADDYFCLFLFSCFNPALKSMGLPTVALPRVGPGKSWHFLMICAPRRSRGAGTEDGG